MAPVYEGTERARRVKNDRIVENTSFVVGGTRSLCITHSHNMSDILYSRTWDSLLQPGVVGGVSVYYTFTRCVRCLL